MIYGTPAHLLGRHVACGAHHGSWIRVDFSSSNISLRHVFAGRLDQFCQAKIENLYAIVFSDKEVVGFEIAVDDSLAMRSGETARYLSCAVDGFARGKRAVIQNTPQSLTFEQFRNDIGRAIVSADIVNGEDVGMIQCPGGLRLLLEPMQAVAVLRECGRQDFDSYIAIQLLIAGAIDLTHSALANLRADFVTAEFCAGGNAHIL